VSDRSSGSAGWLAPQSFAGVETVAELALLLRELRRREARLEGATPLTYRDLAAKTGWSRGIIGEYFAGRVLPPTDRFDVLVRLLGAGPAEQGLLATARDRVEERRRTTRLGARRTTPADATMDRADRADRADRGARVAATRQLPAAVPGFAGRLAQVAALDSLVDQTAAVPVLAAVVSGTAGVGKTALALHWANRVADRFPDGQLFLNLRGFDPTGTPVAPAQAVRALLDMLGVGPQRIPATVDAQSALYRGMLADRRVLVLLDNARDADQVRPLLPGGTTSRALVTSRNELAGLVTAEAARPVTLGLLSGAEARQLLAARLGADRLAAWPRAADDIVESCARLPLALSIVAARAALRPEFPLDALAGELAAARDRLEPFSGQDPATDVRAVFSWSYRVLSPAAARLFRLLALHPGPEAAVAALASLAGLPSGEVRPLLTELVRANLVAEHVPGRYACHDLLLAYAAELVRTAESAGPQRAATRRVLDHYLRTAHRADLRLDPHRDPIPLPPVPPGVAVVPLADHGAAMDWFTTELPVLLAAVDRAAETGFDTYLCRLTRTMAHFLERRGHWDRWAAAQRTARAATGRLEDPVEEAHARRSLGRVAVHLGLADEATAHFAAAMAAFRAAGDHAGQGRIGLDLGWLAVRQGQPLEALRYSRQALRVFTRGDHRCGQGRALNNIGWCLGMTGDYEQAARYCRRALSLQTRLDDRFGLADTWDSLGHAEHRLGRYRQAAEAYQRSRLLWQELGHRYQEADLLTRIGETERAVGDLAGARGTWQRALEILVQLDHPDAEQMRGRLDRLDSAPAVDTADECA